MQAARLSSLLPRAAAVAARTSVLRPSLFAPALQFIASHFMHPSLDHASSTTKLRPSLFAPALQLQLIPLPTVHRTTRRAYHINPYTGMDTRDEERQLQRKSCQHGLKVDWVEFSTTAMERARNRLRESAEQRRRRASANGARSKQSSS